jgi:hypothetical protein
VYHKILTFLNELKEHPRTGTGKPELLSGDEKGQEDGIVTVKVVSAFGHYGDK